MKRTALTLFALLLSTSLFAGEATQRYLVATKRPYAAGAAAAVAREARGITLRDARGFESFNGFAADLTPTEAAALRASSEVRYVEPVVERHALAVERDPKAQTVPYGVTLLHAKDAWQGRRAGTVNVVVIDTGVDYRHDELKAIWAGGTNIVNHNDDPLDDNGHGTHVAGTIAAADNTLGVVGVVPAGVRLWSVKVLDANGIGSTDNIISALDWVIQKKRTLGGNWVLNLSLGSKIKSDGEEEAFQRAADNGIIICAASGNESNATHAAAVLYPASYNSVLAVGAIDSEMVHAEFSNQGPELDFVAPGVEVLSTLPVGSGFITYLTSGDKHLHANGLVGSKIGTVTGEYVYCGLGKKEDIPASVAGKIALIQRGEIRFTEKTRNAKAAGASAVVIFNLDVTAINWTLMPEDDPEAATYDWPVTVGISKADGEALAAQGHGTMTIVNERDDYGVKDGTSMATPHVTGSVALLWTLAPKATPAQLVAALRATAIDLGGPGNDNVYGDGLISLYQAALRLAPEAFPPQQRPSTGRRYVRH
ncbi:MAG TPA: S8 family serine peptidase [Thermoanaerobaculia bacterium]|jgi:subtilisin family serine protease